MNDTPEWDYEYEDDLGFNDPLTILACGSAVLIFVAVLAAFVGAWLA